METVEMYKKLDALDKRYKPLILKWLCELFHYKDYPHSFKDQWINWNVWNGKLSVSFDHRVEEQIKLLYSMHPRFKGEIQLRTLKIVNENIFYLELDRLLSIDYPDITGSKLLKRDKHPGGTGGWRSKSDAFYTYDWEVYLSDGTSIFYHNQENKMDMIKGDYSYNSTLQQRAFIKFLEKYS